MRVFAREFFYNFKAVQRITSSLSTENLRGKNTVLSRENENPASEIDA
jgi:hypothetical protein